NHTINQVPDADQQLWMMMGDFNSRSSIDNYFYKLDPASTGFLVHDYILQETPYVDVIAETYPGEFKTSCLGNARIDFVYCTKPLMDRVKHADIVRNDYTEPVRHPQNLSNFCLPSDHRPIVVDFDMKKSKKSKK
ncbi:MAG: endonuclease, partial [Muribaculaceae bacterium]|nr:endonuclease [Muribaculaceae bacterium]